MHRGGYMRAFVHRGGYMGQPELADAVAAARCRVPDEHAKLVEAAEQRADFGPMHPGQPGERREVDLVRLSGVAERGVGAGRPEPPRLAEPGKLAGVQPLAREAEPLPELPRIRQAAR